MLKLKKKYLWRQQVNFSVAWRTRGVIRHHLPCVLKHTWNAKKISFSKFIRSVIEAFQWCGKFPVAINTTFLSRKSARINLLNIFTRMWLNGDYFPKQHQETDLYNGGAVCSLRMVVIWRPFHLLQSCSVGDTWKNGYAPLVGQYWHGRTAVLWGKPAPRATVSSTNPTWIEPEPARWEDGDTAWTMSVLNLWCRKWNSRFYIFHSAHCRCNCCNSTHQMHTCIIL